MNKEKITVLRSVLKVLDKCVLKRDTTIAEALDITLTLQNFGKIVVELEKELINHEENIK